MHATGIILPSGAVAGDYTLEVANSLTCEAIDTSTSGFELHEFGTTGFFTVVAPDVSVDAYFKIYKTDTPTTQAFGKFDGSRWLLIGQNYKIPDIDTLISLSVSHEFMDTDQTYPTDTNGPVVWTLGVCPIKMLNNGTFIIKEGIVPEFTLGTYDGTTWTPSAWLTDLIANGGHLPPNSVIYLYANTGDGTGFSRWDPRGRTMAIKIRVETASSDAHLYCLLDAIQWGKDHIIRADGHLEPIQGSGNHYLALSGSLTVTPERMMTCGVSSESSRGAIEGAIPTVGEIADGVWDEDITLHTTTDSAGEALTSAGAAGDPWGTALPGAYTAGEAGYILANQLAKEATVLGQFNVTKGIIVSPSVSDNSDLTVYEESCTPITFSLGTGWPLAGKEVWFVFRNYPAAATALLEVEATVTDAVNGVAVYTPTTASFPTPGRYHYEVYVCTDDAQHSSPQSVFVGRLHVKPKVRT